MRARFGFGESISPILVTTATAWVFGLAMYQYVGIYRELLASESCEVKVAMLRRWLVDHDDERVWLESLSTVATVSAFDDEDLWRLYALSRVNDLLLLGSEPPHDDYVEVMTGLGMRIVKRDAFHPFFHEVVAIEASDDSSTPPRIQREIWPCLFLGNLLFSRAGCAIDAGRNHMDPTLAAHTTLYWTHRRSHRPVQDLSVGWGHNSQWRTPFRRDYWLGPTLHYNVDAHLDVRAANLAFHNPAREDLPPDERVELLRHRCFVRTRKPHHDLWPYDDRLVEPDL